MKNKNDFEYKYVAPTTAERKEIESIRDSYITQNKTSDKLSYLRKLDGRVKNIPTIVSLAIGIIGLLIFGLGMAMVLEWKLVVWGVIVDIVALIPMVLAYPTYANLCKHLKSKYSEEIIKISEELLNDEK